VGYGLKAGQRLTELFSRGCMVDTQRQCLFRRANRLCQQGRSPDLGDRLNLFAE